MTDTTSLYYLLAAVLVAIGVAGVILPALPGIPLVFAGLLLAAWAGGFAKIGVFTVVVLGALTLLSLVVDFWATALGAKRVGASRKALAGAMLGMLGGLVFGPIGVFVGPFVGAVAGELLDRRGLRQDDLGHAARIGAGTWLGILLGMAMKLALAFTMLGLFALAWFV